MKNLIEIPVLTVGLCSETGEIMRQTQVGIPFVCSSFNHTNFVCLHFPLQNKFPFFQCLVQKSQKKKVSMNCNALNTKRLPTKSPIGFLYRLNYCP